MNNSDDQSRKKHISTDDLIIDYLDDLFGNTVVETETIEPQPSKFIFDESSIQRGQFLIPTFNPYNPLGKPVLRSQYEATLILLTNLYFLRRPLSPRVRQCFLDLSEYVIDDYHAAQWMKEVRHLGALSEV